MSSILCILFSGFGSFSINSLSHLCCFNKAFSFGGINILSFSSIIIFLGLIAFSISISLTFCILLSGWSIPSIVILSMPWLFKGIFSLDGINKLSFSSIIILIGLGVLNISILSTSWILFSGLLFPSIIILSTFWFFKGSFIIGGINKESFSSIIIFLDFGVLNISILSIFWILFSGLLIPSTNILSIIWDFNGSFFFGSINILSFFSIIFWGLGDFNISILSIFWIVLSYFLILFSIIKSSTNCFSKGSFSFLGIKNVSFSSMEILVVFGAFNISILSTSWILFSGLLFPSINKLSTFWFFNGSFILGEINILSLSSIIFSGLGAFKIVILSIFCILFSGFIIFLSIIKSSTNCFVKGSFSFGYKWILSLSSIIFKTVLGAFKILILSILWISFLGLSAPSIDKESTNCNFKGFFGLGNISILSLDSTITLLLLGILNISNLSIFCTLFSGFILINFSIYKSSTNCFFKGSLSFLNISKLSLGSITFLGLGVLNIDNLSIFWILFSGFIKNNPSIYKSSTNCFFKGSPSFFNDIIWILSLGSIIFWGLALLSIVNLSIFCILFSGFIKNNPSIYNSSTNCFFKGSLSIGNISKLSFGSITFCGFGVLNIDNLSTFWILFSGFINKNPSIYKSSTNCFFKGDLSKPNNSIESLGETILFNFLRERGIVNLSIFCILFSGFIKNNPSIYKSSTNCFFKGSLSIGNISKLSFGSIIILFGVNINSYIFFPL